MLKASSVPKVPKGEFYSVVSLYDLLDNAFSAMSIDNEEWELTPHGCVFSIWSSSIYY